MKKILLIIGLFTTNNIFSQKITPTVKEIHQFVRDFYKDNPEQKEKIFNDFDEKYNSYTKALQELDNYVKTSTNYYRYYNTDKELIKGVRFYHENDLFGLFQKNQDHEYTGGFQIDIITDFFGLKVLSFRPDDKHLTYQSITFGFELYTPSEINVLDPGNLNPNDRPFASFQYFGRTRNIINIDGDYRSSSETKIGVIGGDVSRNVQMVVHNDVTPGSSVNKGWDYQIGNGGRLGLQYNLLNEWQQELFKHLFINYGFGHIKTNVKPVFTLTNKTFFLKNSHNSIHTDEHLGTTNIFSQIKNTWFYEVKYEPEYVQRNTMLQGYPFSNEHNVIGNNSDTVEILVIENINNFVHRFSFGFKNYRTTLHYQHFFQSPEYNVSNNSSWDNKTFHHYGRISLTLDL